MAKKTKAAGGRVGAELGAPLEIEEVPIPEPKHGEVLIKVVANGVCHTDLHSAHGDFGQTKLPFIPGHEGAGIIAAVGPGGPRLKGGDRAGGGGLHDSCGWCEHCRTGWDSLCLQQHNSGFTFNGSFAEYVIGSAPYFGGAAQKSGFPALAPRVSGGRSTHHS